MIYKYTSIKVIIAKVFADLHLKEGDHRILDLIEWCSEALLKIGAFPSLITKVTGKDDVPIIPFTNYQAKLPGDLHSLVQIAYSTSESGPFYPMRYGTGSFDYGRILNTEKEITNVLSGVMANTPLVDLTMSLYSLTYEQALTKLNTEPAIRSQLIALLGSSTPGVDTISDYAIDYTYVIVGGYIKLNVSNGYLLMSYQAVPTDKDGYPLIPDNESFMEALYWYVTMKLLYPEWTAGRVRDAVYYDARRSWSYYRKQAYGEAMMPSADQLESIKNTWLKLVPEIKEHDTFYSTVGQEQIIYNANA